MLIIIDGYNVLKPLSGSLQVSDRRRKQFIDRVTTYTRNSGNRAIIVFDGGDSPFPERIKQNGLLVIYSGYRDSADDIIKKLLCEKHPDDTLLVSTDRELCSYAQRFTIASIDSHVFYGYLRDTLEEVSSVDSLVNSGLHKRPGHKSSSEVDKLMQEASDMMTPHSDRDLEHESQHNQKRKNGKKLSKEERRLRKIVKKL